MPTIDARFLNTFLESSFIVVFSLRLFLKKVGSLIENSFKKGEKKKGMCSLNNLEG